MRIYAPSWNSKSLAQVSRVSPISLCIAVLQLVWFPRFPYGSSDHAPSVPHCEGLDARSCNSLSTGWKSEQGGDMMDRKGWQRTECWEKGQKLRATVLKTWKYALKYTRKKGGRDESPSPHRPTGWRDKSSQTFPSLSFFLSFSSSLATLSAGLHPRQRHSLSWSVPEDASKRLARWKSCVFCLVTLIWLLFHVSRV